MRLFTSVFLGVVACALLYHAHLRGDKVFKISFLDVGQGDAIFVQAPSGAQLLIDGGKDQLVLSRLGKVMPFLDRSIDAVVATHPDADHVAGLADVLSTYSVSDFYYNSMKHDTPQVTNLEGAAAAKKLTPKSLRKGDIIMLDPEVSLHVLAPRSVPEGMETNEASVVLKVVYKNVSALLTGDAPSEVESRIVSEYGHQVESMVLKLGHHGSQTSSSDTFLGFVKPKYAIISRGCENDYGHPHKEVLDTLQRFSIPALDTCKEGTVTFSSDGFTLVRE
jgi:beta-lactamase superfamily II metal-dependent hydrolase